VGTILRLRCRNRYRHRHGLHQHDAPCRATSEVAREELADILGCDSPESMESSPLVKKWNASKLRLWPYGNILIEFKSAERPERLVARGLDGAWFDEAARCPQVAWANLRARLADRQGWCPGPAPLPQPLARTCNHCTPRYHQVPPGIYRHRRCAAAWTCNRALVLSPSSVSLLSCIPRHCSATAHIGR
jgi:hypothetical protein